jgi:hypothetical protein
MGNPSTFFPLWNCGMNQRFFYGPANIFFIIIGLGIYLSSLPILASGLLYKKVKMGRKEKK